MTRVDRINNVTSIAIKMRKSRLRRFELVIRRLKTEAVRVIMRINV